MLSAFQIWWPDSAGGNETHERKHRRSTPTQVQVPSRIRMVAVCATLRENA